METKIAETKLFLRENEVWAGMTVVLCLEGKKEPEQDETGKPLVLMALIGGVPARRKFYPTDGGIQIHHTPKHLLEQGAAPFAIVAHPLEGFRPDIRFMPVQTFTPADAPPNTNFAVFSQGKSLKYSGKYSGNSVVVRTDEQQHILSDCGYAYDWWQREYPLPEDAVLIPITEIGNYPEQRYHRRK